MKVMRFIVLQVNENVSFQIKLKVFLIPLILGFNVMSSILYKDTDTDTHRQLFTLSIINYYSKYNNYNSNY